MKKNILNLKGAEKLSKAKQSNIKGGSSSGNQSCSTDRDCNPSNGPGWSNEYACVKERPWYPTGVCVLR